MFRKKKRVKAAQQPRFGQFDRSFVLRVIRNYFLSALVLLLILVGFTYVIIRYQFETDVPEETHQTAQSLASDVTSIMINKGGPVASRTVYPILQRNYERLGYRIAILPSEDTVKSITEQFGFEPEGLPAKWPEQGDYHEARITLKAQEFCLQCHVTADVGDPLGTVEVRNYFGSFVEQWQEDATLSAIAGMGNIIVSTIIMFFVMRLRMEPILNLRSMVSRWAKGSMPLDERIEVKSQDEFGELSHDLNLTLDRIFGILQDLRVAAERQLDLNSKVGHELDHMSQTAEKLHGELRSLSGPEGETGSHTLDELTDHINHLRALCENLEDNMRNQQLLIKRLE